jgi:hypothetical protein
MSDNDDNTMDEEIAADIMVKAARLDTSVAPGRDLWPDIEQAITAPPRRQRSAWGAAWSQAAAVVLLVGGSSALTYLAMSGDEDATVPAAVETAPLAFEPVSGSFGSQYNLGPDYIDARRVVAGNLDERLEELPPETRDAVRRNMATIRAAIDDINRALAEDPDNVLLQQLLIDTYLDELALMRKVDGISNAAMFREDI